MQWDQLQHFVLTGCLVRFNERKAISLVKQPLSPIKNPCKRKVCRDLIHFEQCSSGERGIRTPGPLTVNGFQDRRNRPLCHLSAAKVRVQYLSNKKSWLFFAKILRINAKLCIFHFTMGMKMPVTSCIKVKSDASNPVCLQLSCMQE